MPLPPIQSAQPITISRLSSKWIKFGDPIGVHSLATSNPTCGPNPLLSNEIGADCYVMDGLAVGFPATAFVYPYKFTVKIPSALFVAGAVRSITRVEFTFRRGNFDVTGMPASPTPGASYTMTGVDPNGWAAIYLKYFFNYPPAAGGEADYEDVLVLGTFDFGAIAAGGVDRYTFFRQESGVSYTTQFTYLDPAYSPPYSPPPGYPAGYYTGIFSSGYATSIFSTPPGLFPEPTYLDMWSSDTTWQYWKWRYTYADAAPNHFHQKTLILESENGVAIKADKISYTGADPPWSPSSGTGVRGSNHPSVFSPTYTQGTHDSTGRAQRRLYLAQPITASFLDDIMITTTRNNGTDPTINPHACSLKTTKVWLYYLWAQAFNNRFRIGSIGMSAAP